MDAVFLGKECKFNRRFLQACNNYLIEPVTCTPAAGWEEPKAMRAGHNGQVANQVGVVHERFFTPWLRFASYAELNAWLLDRYLEYARAHGHLCARWYETRF